MSLRFRVAFAAATIGAICASAMVAGGALATQAQAAQKTGDGAAEPATPGAAPTLRLMSQSQYIHTIANVFGPDIANNIRFAPVKRTDGLLAVGASAAVVTPGALDRLESAARSVAAQVVDVRHQGYLVPCKPADEKARDDACARQFLSEVGLLLYRRPLTERELALKVDLAGASAGGGRGFYRGLSFALTSVLVAPQFLLIRESLEADPNRVGGRRLDGYSKAARLSFLLWDSAPDEELLAAAARGELHNEVGLRRQVERMLSAPQMEQGARAFFEDFLVLEAFDNLAKDPVIYPAFTATVAKESREQVLRTVTDHLVARREDYRDLFTTRRTIMSAGLASLYRVPMLIKPKSWAAYEFAAEDPRAGILTQVAFLSQYAHPGRSSPTRRGRGIREVLMCQHVPDPPPNVDFSIVEDPNAKFSTAKERLTAHNTDPTCAGCHKITDPIGLALEKFDGAGQFRETEHGAAIDASGALDGVRYADAAGLGRAMHDSPAVRACIVSRLYAYGVGRPVAKEEDALLGYFQAQLDRTGYRLNDMLRTIVYSRAFFTIQGSDPQATRTAALAP